MTLKKRRKLHRKQLRKKQKEILLRKISALETERKKARRKQITDPLFLIIIGMIMLAEPVSELVQLILIIIKIIRR
ncbi:MAG: hypothetical protein IJJ69_14705 [Oscillospiraceae bacterium]|nr:hypothetical protein [Oscillospiraceae bacterium]